MARVKDSFAERIRTSLPALPKSNKEHKKPVIDPELAKTLTRLGEVTLAVLGATGVLTIALLAPNILQLLAATKKWSKILKTNPRKTHNQLVKNFQYLRAKRYVHVGTSSLGEMVISLTTKGWQRYNKLQFDKMRVPKPLVWDKSWWCVAADIPTKQHRIGADLLRYKLKTMNFYALQRTMWFYPYNPSKEINTITKAYNIGHFVTVMKVTQLEREDEKRLRHYFLKHGVL